MQQDKITVSKKLVYRVAVGLAALLVILLLLWKQNTDRSQTPSPYNNQSSIASLKVGEPAPAFTLDSLDGGQVALSDFKGKAVLINFWASWCQPCREEIPDLIRAYTAHQAEGFIVLGINMT
ncbi:MAG TPA: TlpA disulfide reductase family protein, partial [Anaerolineales bacterium]|nr:TlpA disulfide reductase family protein [Anaerolineales bacterium]